MQIYFEYRLMSKIFFIRLLHSVDRRFFLGKLNYLYKHVLVEKFMLKFKNSFYDHNIICQYKKNNYSILNSLCDKYGSDKGEIDSHNNPYNWPSHSYADLYDLFFKLRRHDVNLIIECGIGTNNPNLKSSMGAKGKPGASLRVWRDYFTNAKIIGLDIDKEILFKEDKIETFYCDQTDKVSIKNFCKNYGLQNNCVDIIIDDGLHQFSAGKTFFENMVPYLSKDGIYIIEDVGAKDMIKYKKFFSEEEKFSVHFFHLNRPNQVINKNRLIVITHNN